MSDLERELAAAIAERDAALNDLKNERKLLEDSVSKRAWKNIQAERDAARQQVTRLRAALTAAEARAVKLETELNNIATANPKTWDSDMQDQFQAWAQSRAHFALAAQEPNK